MPSLSNAPLPLIGGVLALGLILMQELGYRLRGLLERWSRTRTDGEGTGHLLSAALALLGLLIAFTFSMAASRYEDRRALVLAEANALSTTYLRVQALDEPYRDRLSVLVLSYGQTRQAFFGAGEDPDRVARSDEMTDALQARIWSEVTAAVRAAPTSTLNPSLLEATNALFDLSASRRAALDARVPAAILRALVLYALVSAAMLGYSLASGGRRHGLASTALFVLVALAMTLILDLDRPRTGAVTISQAPFTRTLDGIRTLEAGRIKPAR